MIDSQKAAGKSSGIYQKDHDIFNLKSRNNLSQNCSINKKIMIEESLKSIDHRMRV